MAIATAQYTITDLNDGVSSSDITALLPSDVEIFTFNRNITGSKGMTPTGSACIYTRTSGGDKFGGDCINVTTGKIIYPGLETQINREKFSVLGWVRNNSSASTKQAIFGANPAFSFYLSSTYKKLTYSFYNGSQIDIGSNLILNDLTTWHLIGISVDKANSKITFFQDNNFEEKTTPIAYTQASTVFTLGQISSTDTSSPAQMSFSNFAIFKNTVITPDFVAKILISSRPFIDPNSKVIVPIPSSPTMAIVDEYVEEGYIPDGYFTYL